MEPIRKRHGANLPHWTRQAGSYAVTFRLADSLPAAVLAEWKRQLGLLGAAHSNGRRLTLPEKTRLQQLLGDRAQQYLDAGVGHCWLKHHAAAQCVHDCLAHAHGEQYWVHAWCIMPNHVHVVLQVAPDRSLSKILQAWKMHSSRRIGRILPVRQPFWQPESYDHLIRDRQDFDHAVRYVLKNPIQAKLMPWPWVGERFSPLPP